MKINKLTTGTALIAITCLAMGFTKITRHTLLAAKNNDSLITVPLGGNAWRVAKDTAGGTITNDGIVDWTDNKVKFTAYFRVAVQGKFKLWLKRYSGFYRKINQKYNRIGNNS